MRLILFAIVIFAAYSAYNQFIAKPEESTLGPSIEPEYETAIYQARSQLEAIRSGISRDAKRNSFSGRAPYPDHLTKDSEHLFDNVLITPILPNKNGWQQSSPHTYTYTYGPGQVAEFTYNPQSGEFPCVSDYTVCQFFE